MILTGLRKTKVKDLTVLTAFCHGAPVRAGAGVRYQPTRLSVTLRQGEPHRVVIRGRRLDASTIPGIPVPRNVKDVHNGINDLDDEWTEAVMYMVDWNDKGGGAQDEPHIAG